MKGNGDLKIAYIGGGSRAWARTLINDLAIEKELSGKVYLYDIDFEAARDNAVIGNSLRTEKNKYADWEYVAVKTMDEVLENADFVIISILPGTFDEMESDVHYPEKYGIIQSVGDSTGPGGILRAMRTIPIYRGFARKIKEICPDAWVVNYTNPMTMCVRSLYEEFNEIKLFGCCHEVFGTQQLLMKALKEMEGIEAESRDDIRIDVSGINHFTWITKATYKNYDLFDVFERFAKKYRDIGVNAYNDEREWETNSFSCGNILKFKLFERYGIIAAAGDRHLAEFMPKNWFLKDEKQVTDNCFRLTTVAWRRKDLAEKLELTKQYVSGKKKLQPKKSNEEGVRQIKALLGMGDFVTNINYKNVGQMKNVPSGAVVETNCVLSGNSVSPIVATELPPAVHSLVIRHIFNQEALIKAVFARDKNKALSVLCNDPLCAELEYEQCRDMFDAMIKNTDRYLKEYWD